MCHYIWRVSPSSPKLYLSERYDFWFCLYGELFTFGLSLLAEMCWDACEGWGWWENCHDLSWPNDQFVMLSPKGRSQDKLTEFWIFLIICLNLVGICVVTDWSSVLLFCPNPTEQDNQSYVSQTKTKQNQTCKKHIKHRLEL